MNGTFITSRAGLVTLLTREGATHTPMNGTFIGSWHSPNRPRDRATVRPDTSHAYEGAGRAFMNGTFIGNPCGWSSRERARFPVAQR